MTIHDAPTPPKNQRRNTGAVRWILDWHWITPTLLLIAIANVLLLFVRPPLPIQFQECPFVTESNPWLVTRRDAPAITYVLATVADPQISLPAARGSSRSSYWSRANGPIPEGLAPGSEVAEAAYGWPLRMLVVRNTFKPAPDQVVKQVGATRVLIPAERARRPLPLGVIGVFLLACCAKVAVLGPIVAYRYLRADIRTTKGLCFKCGYPRSSRIATCPECGDTPWGVDG